MILKNPKKMYLFAWKDHGRTVAALLSRVGAAVGALPHFLAFGTDELAEAAFEALIGRRSMLLFTAHFGIE